LPTWSSPAAGPAVASAPPAPAPAAVPGEDDLAAKVQKTHASLQGKNYYEIFGLTQATFSFDQLKKNYFALTRQFGPDLLMQLAGAEAALAEAILAAVADAYNTLSDIVRKENYDQLLGSNRVGLGQKGDDRFQAQVQSQSGKVFIEMEEWDNAETALQDACNIDPNNGDYQAHLAWAIYRNPRNAASRAMQEKARQLLNRALTLERTAAGFAFKGWMLFEAGEDTLAEGEFNKALKLDARQQMARKGLRNLQETRERERKGLFRRMFG
jgi:curved DNA-binding protein CbpA